MSKTHARYWIDADLKKEIETIASKNERWSASYIAEQLLQAGLVQFKANLVETAPASGLRQKIGKIKK